MNRLATPAAVIRRPAVAGSFYPAEPARLRQLLATILRRAAEGHGADRPPGLTGILVPHAGLVYSGVVAAAAWRLVTARTVVILGTNHSAVLDGVAAWDGDAWGTPLGDVEVDRELAAAIVALGPPFVANRLAHQDEHSIEVQLPILAAVAPGSRIVALSVAAGSSGLAIAAGTRLGELLAALRGAGSDVAVAISTDLAHYPGHADALRATALLAPAIIGVDPLEVAVRERSLTRSRIAGMACGMCGIDPTVLGLAALAAMGVTGGTVLASATSADAGGAPDRTVGYLAVEFRSPGDAAAPVGDAVPPGGAPTHDH
jgi:AmmeMemoRadiSam system protein B